MIIPKKAKPKKAKPKIPAIIAMPEVIKDFYKISHRKQIGIFLKKHNLNKLICEVGVFKGSNLIKLLKTAQPTLIYGIDNWDNTGISNHHISSNIDPNEMYNNLKQIEIDNYNLKIIKGLSVDTAKNFPDRFFDFIYLDASHDYSSVKNDIKAYWPKVKINGILAGHDYSSRKCGLKIAVNEFRDEYNITHFHITSERCPSWLFIKEN